MHDVFKTCHLSLHLSFHPFIHSQFENCYSTVNDMIATKYAVVLVLNSKVKNGFVKSCVFLNHYLINPSKIILIGTLTLFKVKVRFHGHDLSLIGFNTLDLSDCLRTKMYRKMMMSS